MVAAVNEEESASEGKYFESKWSDDYEVCSAVLRFL